MKLRLLGCVATLFLATAYSDGAVIVQYDTAASGDFPAITATTVNPAVSAVALSAGPGLNSASGATWNWNGFDVASTSFGDAVAAGDFFTWGFDVLGLNTVALTTMDVRWDRSGTGPDDFEIQATVNGGTPVSLLTFDYADSSNGVDFVGVDLTGIGSLSGGDSLVFTLAAFNSESAAGTFDLETVDFNGSDPRSLRIEGTVTAIPEPGSFVALGVIAIGGLVVRCRRMAAKA